MKEAFKPRILYLPLKKQWFDMIASGKKRHEYRDLNRYWTNRLTKLVAKHDEGENRKWRIFDYVEFTCGYPRRNDTSRRLRFDNPVITISVGDKKMGASGYAQFDIMFGNQVNI